MKVTKVYTSTLEAYTEGYRYIINKGSSRSSKTFSELQVFKTICDRVDKPEVNTIVSHSLPHLTGGAIRDFDNILTAEGINVDSIRTKHPYIYRIGKQVIEFVGFDKPGKALGAARDRLFINEANKMPFSTCHQLMQRTRGAIFIDYNPSHSFWVDQEGYSIKKDAIVIPSTFRDNIQNLTSGQIDDFAMAKQKHDEEIVRGNKGYWFNWWRVYGLGLDGIIEGSIFSNWKVGEFDDSLTISYGLDFGSKDPDALVKCAINHKTKTIYLKEEIYQNGLSTWQLVDLINSKNVGKSLIIADSSAARTIQDLQSKGLNVRGVIKGAGSIVEGIKLMQDYTIVIDPDSINLAHEFTNYVWLDRKGEVPIDKYNHLLDAARYIITTLIRPTPRAKTKYIPR